MTIDFISVPGDIKVPPSWKETPDQDQVKADQVAQSYFASWEDKRLENVHIAITIGGVASLIGAGVAVYFVSIPGIILCGAALTICLIGSNAIRREQIARCRKICLQLEDWLIRFKESCKELKEKLEPLQDSSKGQDDKKKKIELDEATTQDLTTILGALPANDLKNLADKLKASHLLLFGEKRRIGQGTWTSWWIERRLGERFGRNLDHFYDFTSQFEKILKKNDKNELTLMALLKMILKDLTDQVPVPDPNRDLNNRTKMWFLTDRLDGPLPPQGKEDFPINRRAAENAEQTQRELFYEEKIILSAFAQRSLRLCG